MMYRVGQRDSMAGSTLCRSLAPEVLVNEMEKSESWSLTRTDEIRARVEAQAMKWKQPQFDLCNLVSGSRHHLRHQ